MNKEMLDVYGESQTASQRLYEELDRWRNSLAHVDPNKLRKEDFELARVFDDFKHVVQKVQNLQGSVNVKV